MSLGMEILKNSLKQNGLLSCKRRASPSSSNVIKDGSSSSYNKLFVDRKCKMHRSLKEEPAYDSTKQTWSSSTTIFDKRRNGSKNHVKSYNDISLNSSQLDHGHCDKFKEIKANGQSTTASTITLDNKDKKHSSIRKTPRIINGVQNNGMHKVAVRNGSNASLPSNRNENGYGANSRVGKPFTFKPVISTSTNDRNHKNTAASTSSTATIYKCEICTKNNCCFANLADFQNHIYRDESHLSAVKSLSREKVASLLQNSIDKLYSLDNKHNCAAKNESNKRDDVIGVKDNNTSLPLCANGSDIPPDDIFDRCWRQLTTYVRLHGMQLDFQMRGGFTGLKGNIFLFEVYATLDGELFSGVGTSLVEAKENAARNALTCLLARTGKSDSNRFVNADDMLDYDSFQTGVSSTNMDINKEKTNEGIVQVTSTMSILKKQLSIQLKRINNINNKLKGCSCHSYTRKATIALLMALHRVADTDKRLIGATPVGNAYKYPFSYNYYHCHMSKQNITAKDQVQNCCSSTTTIKKTDDHENRIRSSSLSLCTSKSACHQQQHQNCDESSHIGVSMIVFCSCWPTLQLVNEVSKQLSTELPYVKFHTPQTYGKLLNTVYHENLPSSVKISKSNECDEISSNRDKNSKEDNSSMRVNRYCSNDVFEIELHFTILNKWNDIRLIEEESISREKIREQLRLNAARKLKEQHKENAAKGLDFFPIIDENAPTCTNNGINTTASAVDGKISDVEKVDFVSCLQARNYLYDMRIYRRRVAMNKSTLFVLQLLIHLFQLQCLIVLDKNSDNNARCRQRVSPNNRLGIKASTADCVKDSADSNKSLSAFKNKLSIEDLESLVDYWMLVKANASMEWLFCNVLYSLAYGDHHHREGVYDYSDIEGITATSSIRVNVSSSLSLPSSSRNFNVNVSKDCNNSDSPKHVVTTERANENDYHLGINCFPNFRSLARHCLKLIGEGRLIEIFNHNFDTDHKCKPSGIALETDNSNGVDTGTDTGGTTDVCHNGSNYKNVDEVSKNNHQQQQQCHDHQPDLQTLLGDDNHNSHQLFSPVMFKGNINDTNPLLLKNRKYI
ncbi:hypothetical protein GJ496_002059 [Pomphorhynchus laevis]|nr:hypothetical protein GJ496_002059 [Pomphorhynchus laevis]